MNGDLFIPPITNPLGKYWDQPNPKRIFFDNIRAIMTKKDFKELHEYSASIPTGVYEGKMWKAEKREGWFLVWFDYSEKSDVCTIKYAPIYIIDKYEN